MTPEQRTAVRERCERLLLLGNFYEFIACTRTDLPAALDALDAAEAKIAELQTMLAGLEKQCEENGRALGRAHAAADAALALAHAKITPRATEAENARLRAAVLEERETLLAIIDAYAAKQRDIYKHGTGPGRASDLTQGKALAAEELAAAIRARA